MKIVDRIPHSAMLETRGEVDDPPVRPIRFPLAIRWYLLRTYRPWRTWTQLWRNLWFLVRG